MKHYHKEITQVEKEVLDKVVCDLCGKKIVQGSYDVDEVTIQRRTGVAFPDSHSGEILSVDMCGECFENKLLPWLRSQGCKETVKDYDY
jgi:hypothetical protein